VSLGVADEQADRAASIPAGEGGALVLALPVWELDLEHNVGSVRERRRDDKRHVSVGERVTETQAPRLGALTDEAWDRPKPRPARFGTAQPLQAGGRYHAVDHGAVIVGRHAQSTTGLHRDGIPSPRTIRPSFSANSARVLPRGKGSRS